MWPRLRAGCAQIRHLKSEAAETRGVARGPKRCHLMLMDERYSAMTNIKGPFFSIFYTIFFFIQLFILPRALFLNRSYSDNGISTEENKGASFRAQNTIYTYELRISYTYVRCWGCLHLSKLTPLALCVPSCQS